MNRQFRRLHSPFSGSGRRRLLLGDLGKALQEHPVSPLLPPTHVLLVRRLGPVVQDGSQRVVVGDDHEYILINVKEPHHFQRALRHACIVRVPGLDHEE